MLHRIIHKDTHEFIRDIDLNYDEVKENEIVIVAPACVGSKRVATFDENGEFVEWTNAKGLHAPKGEDDEQRQSD